MSVFSRDDAEGMLHLYPSTGENEVSHKPAITIEKANKLLAERGTVVYNFEEVWHPDKKAYGDSPTHKALLINIEPIEERKVTITRADLERAWNKVSRYSIAYYDAKDGPPKARDYGQELIKELGL